MIKRLTLQNYRSHENTTIEFGTITGLVGMNNHGKTNVFRALRTIVTNGDFRPKDIRRGTKKASIEVEFTNGSKISRTRTPSSQELIVTLADGTVRGPYAKVSDMSDLVQEVSGFFPIKFTKADTNEFIQVVPVGAPQNFLVGNANAETVLKRINKLAGGSGIEATKVKLTNTVKQVKSNLQVNEAQLLQAEQELDKYTKIPLETVNSLFTKASEVQVNIDTHSTKLTKIKDTQKAYDTVNVSQLTKLKSISTEIRNEFEKIQETVDKLATSKVNYNTLVGLESEFDTLLNEIKQAVINKKALAQEIKTLEQQVEQENIARLEEEKRQMEIKIQEDMKKKQEKSNNCQLCGAPL
jgi:exonuclease SbcC